MPKNKAMNVNKFFHKGKNIQPKKTQEVDDEPPMKIPIKKKKALTVEAKNIIPSSKTVRHISGNYNKKKSAPIVEEESDNESIIENSDDEDIIINYSEDEDIIDESDKEESEEDILGFESEIIEEKPKKSTKITHSEKSKKKTTIMDSKKSKKASIASKDILDMARNTLDMPQPKVEGIKVISTKSVSTSSRMTADYIQSLDRPLPEEIYEMDEFDLSTTSFKGSIIDEVEVEGVAVEKKNYFNVISSIYEYLENYENVKKHGGINVHEGKLTGKGFVYLQDLDISVQYVSADRSIIEIFEQVLGNGMNFRMEVSTREKRYIFVNE